MNACRSSSRILHTRPILTPLSSPARIRFVTVRTFTLRIFAASSGVRRSVNTIFSSWIPEFLFIPILYVSFIPHHSTMPGSLEQSAGLPLPERNPPPVQKCRPGLPCPELSSWPGLVHGRRTSCHHFLPARIVRIYRVMMMPGTPSGRIFRISAMQTAPGEAIVTCPPDHTGTSPALPCLWTWHESKCFWSSVAIHDRGSPGSVSKLWTGLPPFLVNFRTLLSPYR